MLATVRICDTELEKNKLQKKIYKKTFCVNSVQHIMGIYAVPKMAETAFKPPIYFNSFISKVHQLKHFERSKPIITRSVTIKKFLEIACMNDNEQIMYRVNASYIQERHTFTAFMNITT